MTLEKTHNTATEMTPTTENAIMLAVDQESSTASFRHEQTHPSLNSRKWRLSERQTSRRITCRENTPSCELANPLLPSLWMGDVLVALSVTAAVAPMLTIVDKAIVEQSARSGQRGVLVRSMQRTAASIASNPTGYYRSPTFGWMWLTYAATYTCANLMKTWNEQSFVLAGRRIYHQHHQASDPPKSTTFAHKKKSSNKAGNMYLVAGTTFVNSGASLIKDRAYARMFGQVPRPVPMASYAAWMMRDGLVIGSGFVLPIYVAPVLQETLGCSPSAATTLSQLVTPVAAQMIAGPLHLWGLTLYNASPEHSFRQTVAAWQRGLVSVTAARMLRILPGYGVAGVVNEKGRTWWKQHLLQRQILHSTRDASAMVTLIRSSATATSGGR